MRDTCAEAARVISVNISPGGIPKLPQPSARVFMEHLDGDGRAHAKHAKTTRAVSLLDDEVLAELRAEGYAVQPGELGENLTVRGLYVQQLAPGMRLRFTGGVEIELTEERKPCFVLDSIHPALKDVMVGRCGFLARVITEGSLASGAEITILPGQRWPHTGAILAGGNSRRMGAPKEGVRLSDGRPMIAHVMAVLHAVCRNVIVVGRCAGYPLPNQVRRIDDLRPDQGPLAGIEALLASDADTAYLLAGCDQPLLTPALLHRLFQAQSPGRGACFTTEERPCFPFPSLVLAEWLPAISTALHQGDRAVCRLFEQLPFARIPIAPAEAWRLTSFNTPTDVERFGDRLSGRLCPAASNEPFTASYLRE